MERIGYQSITQEVTLAAGQTAEINFDLVSQALGLDEIVVTGTQRDSVTGSGGT